MSPRFTYLFLSITLSLTTTIISTAIAQTPSNAPSREEVEERILKLETQMDAMRDELTRLKQSLPPSISDSSEAHAKPASAVASSVEAKFEKAAAPRQESKAATSQSQSSGFDVGPAHVVPYGTIYFNAFGNSGGTNNADVPLFATPSGTGNVSASVRQTRLGLRLEGPKVGDAKASGVIEADFFGGFPNIGNGENFDLVRLRLAYARLNWERTSLEAGQDWVLFAPANPVSIAAAAIPQMASAGNNWARMPQVRFEHRFSGGKLLWQGAVLAPSTGDFPSSGSYAFVLQPGTGSASRTPFVESRLAISEKSWFGSEKPGSLGISVHYGRARVANTPGNSKIDSAGVALDWNMPMASRFTISGEAFFGRNLAGFQGGVFQGYNPDFAYRRGSSLIAGGPRAIGSRGGWAQAGFTPPVLNDRLTLYATYGLDDPRDGDLVSITKRDWRLRNQGIAFSSIYKLTPQFSIGLEYRRLETDYLQSGRQTANHLNLGAAYSF